MHFIPAFCISMFHKCSTMLLILAIRLKYTLFSVIIQLTDEIQLTNTHVTNLEKVYNLQTQIPKCTKHFIACNAIAVLISMIDLNEILVLNNIAEAHTQIHSSVFVYQVHSISTLTVTAQGLWFCHWGLSTPKLTDIPLNMTEGD